MPVYPPREVRGGGEGGGGGGGGGGGEGGREGGGREGRSLVTFKGHQVKLTFLQCQVPR